MNIPYTFIGDASLPSFYRRYIKWRSPTWVIQRIDKNGRIHDWLTYIHPKKIDKNRSDFIGLLHKDSIPSELIIQIHFGVWVYDKSPHYIKRILKKTTH